jgi:hypothetical protein
MPDRLAQYTVFRRQYTEQKGSRFSRLQTGCHLPHSTLPIIKLFPARESLVSDIPAEDGKISNLFLQCNLYLSPLSLRYSTLHFTGLLVTTEWRSSV